MQPRLAKNNSGELKESTGMDRKKNPERHPTTISSVKIDRAQKNTTAFCCFGRFVRKMRPAVSVCVPITSPYNVWPQNRPFHTNLALTRLQ